jgi:hypothetical protein
MDGAWIEDDSDQERLVFDSSAQTLSVYDATGTLLESGTYRFVSAGDTATAGGVSEDRIVVTMTGASGAMDFYLYDSTDSLNLVDYEMVSFTDASDSSKKLIWWELKDSSGTNEHSMSDAIIMIMSPIAGQSIDQSSSIDLSVQISNFTVGTESGSDGHWHYRINNGTDTMVFSGSTDSIGILSVGSYTVEAFLVNNDANNTRHTSNASDTVTFEVTQSAGTGGTPIGGSSWTLDSGWNLVGLVVDSTDVLTTVVGAQGAEGGILSIWHYDASDGWSSYLTGDASSTSSLTSLTGGNAYWVNVAEGETVSVNFSGNTLVATPMVVSGWNMRAALQQTTDLSSYVSAQGVDAVWGWQDDFWQSYIAGTPQFLNFLQQMEMGKGYYLYKQ